MFRLIWAISVRVRDLLRWAPSHLLRNRIRTPRGLAWGTAAMLLAIPLLFAAAIAVKAAWDGGLGWLNLAVIVLVWDAMKLLTVGPPSLVLLARTCMARR